MTRTKKRHIIIVAKETVADEIVATEKLSGSEVRQMKKDTLTKSELEIMTLLWHVDKPLTASEIIEHSTGKTWKDSYIHLLINSLLNKGMIRAEGFAKTTKNYARTFTTAVTKAEYAVRQITGKQGLCTDTIISIVSALVDRSESPDELICALEKLVTEKKEKLQ